ncbi:hypothetical protein DJ428_25020, partial [Salmonella enterica]|nr:hypothetical protein [Salmonella enterica]
FMAESYLPAFQQAIEDTIGALNTGVWRTREGAEIRRIPSLHHLRDAKTRTGLAKVVRELDGIRRTFKRHLAEGGIEHCPCGDPNCPMFVVRPQAAHDLDKARAIALDSFGGLWPDFDVRVS